VPAIERKKVYSPLTDGLNDFVAPVLLGEGEAAELLNCEVNERSILEKYKGYTKDHSPFPDNTDSFIRLLLNYRKGTSVDDLLMFAQDNANTNTNFKVDAKKTSGAGVSVFIGHTTGTAIVATGTDTTVTGTGTAWTSHIKVGDKFKRDSDADSEYTEVSSVDSDVQLTLDSSYAGTLDGGSTAYTIRIILHKDFIPRGTVFNNKAIITNGSETPETWDNATLDLITDTDVPRARYITTHKQRIFMASTSGSPSDIFWSAVNDESSWDPAAFEKIFPQDNGNIISIKSFGDSLVILKNNGNIYQVIGNFDATAKGEIDFIRRIDAPENIGAISERTPVVHQSFLYFLAETGIYRIDQRMFVEKVTFNADNFIGDVSFSLGPTQAKTYNLDIKSEWDNGTFDGTRIISAENKIKNYFDEVVFCDAKQSNNLISVFIDSNKDVHLVYVDSATGLTIRYKKWLSSDNSVSLEEDVVTDTGIAIRAVSIAVASNGDVGVAYHIVNSLGPFSTEDVDMKFSERTGGSWVSPVTLTPSGLTGNNYIQDDPHPLSIAYTTGNAPRIVANFSNLGLYYRRRVSSVWQTEVRFDNSGSQDDYHQVSLVLDGTNNPRTSGLKITGLHNVTAKTLQAFKSDSDGTSSTWSSVDSLVFDPVIDSDHVQIDLNAAGNLITGFTIGTSGLKKRNHTTTTTSTIDSDTTDQARGYRIDNDKDHSYHVFTASPNQQERYYFEDTSNITNPATNVLALNIRPGDRGLHNNGKVFASIAFGVNVNEIVVHRNSFRGIYTSQEFSDSTLATWGTYEISGQVDNSATVTHEVALSVASPPTVFNTITNGQLISTDPAKIFLQNKITFVLGGWGTPEVDSVVMNYTGAGVDSKQAEGISFNNELFFAVSQKTSSNNDRLLISDIRDRILKTTHPVSSLEVYKNKLYGGLSTKGDLIILKQGFNFDGVAYSSDFQSKEDFLESIELEKDIYKFYVLYEVKSIGEFNFSYRLDNFTLDTDVPFIVTTVDQTTAGITPGVAEILVGNKARSIQWRIENKNLDEQLGIIAVVIVFGVLNIR